MGGLVTTKEQELWRDIANSLYIGFTTTEACNNRANELLSKARECYSEELQSERMVTFKLSQQVEKLESERKFAQERMENQLNQKLAMRQLLEETKRMHLRYDENRDWLERRDKIIGGKEAT